MCVIAHLRTNKNPTVTGGGGNIQKYTDVCDIVRTLLVRGYRYGFFSWWFRKPQFSDLFSWEVGVFRLFEFNDDFNIFQIEPQNKQLLTFHYALVGLKGMPIF